VDTIARMPFFSPFIRLAAAALALAGLTVTGVSSAGQHPTTAAAAPPRHVSTIDRLTSAAKAQYAAEVHSAQTMRLLHRVGRDRTLLRLLASGRTKDARAYVHTEFRNVWYGWHVSRVRIVRGGRVVAEEGVPFVNAGPKATLRDAGGRAVGTVQVSIQDEIGFVRFMHRNYPVDVVVRGKGAAHIRTSLAAAANAHLPDSGTATVAGVRYQVRSFRQMALANEPVKVWILKRG
jgi:hypothetical protein